MAVAQEVLEVIQLLNTLTNLVQGMAPQQANAPVVLPVTPPPAYIAPTVSDIGDEVWNYPVVNAPVFSTGESLGALTTWWYALGFAQASFRAHIYGGYRVGGHWSFNGADVIGPTITDLDFSTIIATDATIFAWASRVYPAVAWVNGGNDSVWEVDAGTSDVRWVIDLTPASFASLKAEERRVGKECRSRWSP